MNSLSVLSKEQRENFLALCSQAGELQLANDVTSMFAASAIVLNLRQFLTKEVVEAYFVPLMGTRVGFLTDRDKEDKNGNKPAPYGWETIRDCVIDAACIGLAPVKNQFNIIAGSMYPTKEGYTTLLKKIGCKYFITKGPDTSAPSSQVANISCKIVYEYQGQRSDYTFTATPKKNAYSSLDQLQGKAERKAKKHLYELLTGIDLGDADEDSAMVDDQDANVKKQQLRERKNTAPSMM